MAEHSGLTVITGANRGIGFEHVKQALAGGEHVIAACRKPAQAAGLQDLKAAYPGKLEIAELEAAEPPSIASFAAALHGRPISVLFNNAGIMGEEWGDPKSRQKPGNMDYDLWREMLQINLVAPFHITEALLPNLRAAGSSLVVMMSSDLGSITQNTMGALHAYRSSKSALNMVMRGLSFELKGDGITVVSMAPGWVRTDLGGASAHWEVDESVRRQRDTMAALSIADTGRFITLNGEDVPW